MSKAYFISYKLSDNRDSGHLCYTGTMTLSYLKDKLFNKDLVVLYISSFSDDGDKTLITYTENNVTKNKVVNYSLSDIEALNRVWLSLKPSEFNVHILSFKVLNDEFVLD